MSMRKLANPPKFDRTKGYGQVYGSGEESSTGRASYCQGGHYYTGDGSYVGSDPDAKNVAAVKEEDAQVEPGARFVTTEELDALLLHEKAEGLLTLPLPTLSAMVRRAGGPSFSGDNAPRQYVAWLIKFTVLAHAAG